MEFSFDRSNESTSHEDGIDTTTIANERLRKAIEKNRARQAERNRTQSQAAQTAAAPEAPPTRPHAHERVHVPTPKSAAVVTRRSVAKPDETEFTPIKRTPRKVASQISYTTTGRKKAKPMDPLLVGYLIKGCWGFCVVMILRLVFATGGVTDFYSQRSLYNDRLMELDRIKKENMQIVHEIERMQTDTAFQKKLVRDNLGFIAADEFLVLFPKEMSVQ